MDNFSIYKNFIIQFINKYKEIVTIIFLAVIFYFIFFHNLGTYSLMDVDETRYVSMARDMFNTKDFMTLYLNGEYFFEKPPLYFWQECLSFLLFGKVNEFTARFPVALLGFILFICCLFYLKTKNRQKIWDFIIFNIGNFIGVCNTFKICNFGYCFNILCWLSINCIFSDIFL